MSNQTRLNRYLKIKIKSLADEAQAIRAEERKVSRHFKNAKTEEHRYDHALTVQGLRDHRVGIVRDEARASLVAYGFLRGIPYERIERPSRYSHLMWRRSLEIAQRFSANPAEKTKKLFEAWKPKEGRNEPKMGIIGKVIERIAS